MENTINHYLQLPHAVIGANLAAQHQAAKAPASAHRKLATHRAVTLRANDLSVLRIAHGRVWVTLSNAGPYSRVLAGDHFLSCGQSLTLLPGQELVMECFESSASNHSATAHFSWETPSVTAHPQRANSSAHHAIGRGILQPLRDLRHALGLVAAATGRLVQGLVRGTANAHVVLFHMLAINFIARRAGTTCQGGSFDMEKKRVAAQAVSCSAR